MGEGIVDLGDKSRADPLPVLDKERVGALELPDMLLPFPLNLTDPNDPSTNTFGCGDLSIETYPFEDAPVVKDSAPLNTAPLKVPPVKDLPAKLPPLILSALIVPE